MFTVFKVHRNYAHEICIRRLTDDPRTMASECSTFNFFRAITSNHKFDNAHETKYMVLENTQCSNVIHLRREHSWETKELSHFLSFL